MNVLIVCAGNTCRSPMAGGLLRKIANERDIKLEVRTAGLAPHQNGRVAENAVAVMKELNVDISNEYSKALTEEVLAWADSVLTVQQSHKDHLLEEFPLMAHKIHYLDRDVLDPYNGSISEYRGARDNLEKLLSRFALSLLPD